MKFGPFTLEAEKCVVKREEWPAVGLTPFETAILQALAKTPGQVVLREEIEKALPREGQGRVMSPQSNGLEVMVRRIRRKLDPMGEIGLIVTVRGQGYALREWPEEKVEQAA
jgi:two-component system, OmpR family, response regulator PhoP